MEPMSLRTRRTLAIGSFFLFIVILPVAALYASGYRLSGFSLVSTGGIHVSVPISNVEISLNGEVVERSNLFNKSFFFDNLGPGAYVVQASGEALTPWSKTLIVESQFVTDVVMTVVPQPIRFVELVPVATSTEEVATSTMKFISQETFDRIELEFIATTTEASLDEEVATSTEDSILEEIIPTRGGIGLYIDGGNVRVAWERESAPPSIFCTRPSLCVGEIILEQGPETVTDASFYKNGLLYRTEESGIFFTEIDVRQPRLQVSVYASPGAEYVVTNGTLYVRDEDVIYESTEF